MCGKRAPFCIQFNELCILCTVRFRHFDVFSCFQIDVDLNRTLPNTSFISFSCVHPFIQANVELSAVSNVYITVCVCVCRINAVWNVNSR